MEIHNMTSNEYYGAVNARFEDREYTLFCHGFKREIIAEYNLAIYIRRRIGHAIPDVVQTSFMSFADDRAWLDKLEEIKR